MLFKDSYRHFPIVLQVTNECKFNKIFLVTLVAGFYEHRTLNIENTIFRKDIVIFPADKGGVLVIQNRNSYVETVKHHLLSYDNA